MISNGYDIDAIALDALRELYRRDFARYAAEQLYITGIEPGSLFKMRELTTGQGIIHSLVEPQRRDHGWIRIVIIKGRQLGASTYFSARAFHMASLNRGISTLLIANDEDTSSAIFEKCKLFYNHLPEDLKPLTRKDNKKELVFENPDAKTRGRYPGLESKMRFQHAKNVLAGTGTTQHFTHISEAAKFNPNVCDFLESSLLPAIHLVAGTVIVNESTAFIGGDYFRSCCERAVSRKSEWIPCFIPWFLERASYALPLGKGEKFKRTLREREIAKIASRGNPLWNVPAHDITDNQFKWRRMIIAGRENGEKIFLQEYPTTVEEAWITQDAEVFDRQRMGEMREALIEPKRFVTITPDGRMMTDNQQDLNDNKNYLAFWKEPEKGHMYDMGVDTAVGMEGGDWSVAEIFDRNTGEQVAEFHVHMDGFDLAEKLYYLGTYYNRAQIGVEMASTGYAVNGGLQRLGYANLYIWRHRERAFPTLSTYSGWKTQRDTKPYMLTVYKEQINKKKCTIHSMVLWNEMYNYIREPSLADASYDIYRGCNGFNDDCVMATGIALVIGDDESMGALKHLEAGDSRTREQIIADALRSGGPAFVDDKDFTDNTTRSISNLAKELDGWKQ